jgi:hypothetical protein
LCGLQKHLLMQITGHPQEGTLRSELNSVLAGITATLRTIVKNDEDSERSPNRPTPGSVRDCQSPTEQAEVEKQL